MRTSDVYFFLVEYHSTFFVLQPWGTSVTPHPCPQGSLLLNRMRKPFPHRSASQMNKNPGPERLNTGTQSDRNIRPFGLASPWPRWQCIRCSRELSPFVPMCIRKAEAALCPDAGSAQRYGVCKRSRNPSLWYHILLILIQKESLSVLVFTAFIGIGLASLGPSIAFRACVDFGPRASLCA
jgi:hypothetical protein